MSSKYKILVVGCGELGSRHLQAVASLPVVTTVVVVDPNPMALALGQQRVQDLPNLSSDLHWTHSLDELKSYYDLCIVATQAKGRCQLVKDIFNQGLASQFLIEKIVAQSSLEYEDLLQFVRDHSLKVWVNCKTRAYPIHQYIKTKLRPGELILFTAMGGNHGLGNNGVHTTDLFAFYDGSPEIQRVASIIEPVLRPSKRGNGQFDLSGTLIGKTAKGNTFTLSYAGDHTASEQFMIVTKSYRCIVDQMLRWVVENDGQGGSVWHPVPFEGNLMVSHMTRTFAADILEKGECQLPTLRDCLPAHRFILDSLQPHFNRLLGKNLDYCPVT